MRTIDEAVFRWINQWPDGLGPVFHFFSEGNKMPAVRLALIALFVALLLAGPTSRKAALLAVASWLVANELCDGLKNSFQMARPSVDFPEAIVRVARLTSFGTASAHAASMSAVAYVFARYFGRWAYLAATVALLTGLSRIYVGVHYPSQVLLGWGVGAFCGFLVVTTWEAVATRRRMRQAGNK